MKSKTITKLLLASVMLFQGSHIVYAAQSADCAYPDAPNISAPYWVCELTPEFAATGYGHSWLSAFSDALKELAKLINTAKSGEDGTAINFTNVTDAKTTTATSTSTDSATIGNVTVTSTFTSRTSRNNNTKSVLEATVSGDTIIVLSKDGCGLTLKNIFDGKKKNNVWDNNSDLSISTNNCSVNDLLQELKQEGVTIYSQSISPKNVFYIRLAFNSN